jgi:NADH-quinone oxidoreductase subunit G
VRRGAVEDFADVVLPVAPTQEKAGTFINWEGRLRPFGQVLASTSLPDRQVLAKLASSLGHNLRIGELGYAHQLPSVPRPLPADAGELDAPSAGADDVRPPEAVPDGVPAAGQALLSTWRMLVDDASGLDCEPYLAASAPRPVARLSAATAGALNLRPDDKLSVATRQGTITLPVVIEEEMVEGVVHLPGKSPGSWVLSTLGVTSGAVVDLSAAKEEQP